MLDASTRRTIFSYEDDKFDLTQITCTVIGPEVYLLIGIDELGKYIWLSSYSVVKRNVLTITLYEAGTTK